MRKKFISACCVLLALVPAEPAFAQDFNGAYVGAQGGWEQADEVGIDLWADDAVASTGGTGLVSVDPEWSIAFATRAGYRLNPSTPTYVRGGYSNARVETNLTGGMTRLWETENRDGWLVGAGIERLFPQSISERLEYRHSDLSEGDGTFDRHRILAGIAYRF